MRAGTVMGRFSCHAGVPLHAAMAPAEPSLAAVLARIRAAEIQYGRPPHAVGLVAVSKQQPAEVIRSVMEQGQRAFGENYVQEALPKISALTGHDLSWHFIGRIQSNKTREIARHFDWVHTLDRLKIAERLSDQRPAGLPSLHCCIEVNLSGEASKAGVGLAELPALAAAIALLPRLKLRGLMCLPTPTRDVAAQRIAFRRLAELARAVAGAAGAGFDTLSMGTSDDFEAAVAEGATLLRIGTAVFGPRS